MRALVELSAFSYAYLFTLRVQAQAAKSVKQGEAP